MPRQVPAWVAGAAAHACCPVLFHFFELDIVFVVLAGIDGCRGGLLLAIAIGVATLLLVVGIHLLLHLPEALFYTACGAHQGNDESKHQAVQHVREEGIKYIGEYHRCKSTRTFNAPNIWKVNKVFVNFAPGNEQKKGTEAFPSSIFTMQTETQIEAIGRMLEPLLVAHPSHFLVEIRIKPTNNIKVFIDADEGMPLSGLIQYNRALYKILEESGTYPDGNFSLEVSSPGVDEPLKLLRQYRKNVGRYLEVKLQDDSIKEGKILEANDDSILLETESGKGKKKEVKQETVLFTDIKKATVQVKF